MNFSGGMKSVRSVSALVRVKQPSFIFKRQIGFVPYEDFHPVDLYSSVLTAQPTSNNKPQTLIFLHGLLGSHENWKLLSKLITKDATSPLHIHSLDLRNHGKSGHSDEHSYEHMATDLDHYVKKHNLSSVTLLGHSMGGKLAMYYSLVRPQNVDKLVIFDASYHHNHDHRFEDNTPPPICTLKCLTAMKQIPLESLKNLKEADEILIKHFPEKSERNFYLRHLELDPLTNRYKWILNLNALHSAQYKILDFPLITTKPLDKPALFIGGKSSHRLGVEYASSVRNLFPKSKIVMLDGGHFIHAEKPTQVAQIVSQFLFKDTINTS